jgi:hypothetical protein
MKRYIIILIVSFVISIILDLSCKKSILDTNPYDTFTDNVVWSSRANADAFVYGAYSSIVFGLYSSNIELDCYTTNSIDNAGTAVTREAITTANDFGFNKFPQIRMCNMIISNASNSTALTDLDKTQLISEGHFLRAMTYFWLAKRFGRIVWVDHLIPIDTNSFALPLETVSSTWQKIMSDCDAAIAGLPKTSLSGRANRYAAFALKSFVGLQAAAYTNDASYFQKVNDACDSIILTGGYKLDPDYEGLFNERGRYSAEHILGVYESATNYVCNQCNDMQTVVPNVTNNQIEAHGSSPLFATNLQIFGAWGARAPAQNLVDDYLVIDNATGKAVRWDQSTQFTSNVTKVTGTDPNAIDAGNVTGTGRINDIMYNNRDKRFAASIVYDSCMWFNQLCTTCQLGNLNRMVYGGLSSCCLPCTNYFWRKGVYDVPTRVYVHVPTDYHWVVFRLGMIYLNKAEALLGLNRIPEAVTALNVTRTLHGGLPPATATTSAQVWTDYKRERRVELAKEGEGDYYFSLLRWGLYGNDANSGRGPGAKIAELEVPATFIDITKNRKHYEVINCTYLNNNIRIFDNTRRYLFPIPQAMIVRNPNLTQNPGW